MYQGNFLKYDIYNQNIFKPYNYCLLVQQSFEAIYVYVCLLLFEIS
jgi:hypothetical protein